MANVKSNMRAGLAWALLAIAIASMLGGVIVLNYRSGASVGSASSPTGSTLGAGKPAPDFSIKTLDGKQIHLREYRGKVVILDFWSITCGPCIEANNHLQKLYDKYRKMDLVIIGLSIDTVPRMVEHFLKSHPVEYPVGLATEGVIRDYGGVLALPLTYVIDRDGKIVRKYEGFSPLGAYQMERVVKKLLSKG